MARSALMFLAVVGLPMSGRAEASSIEDGCPMKVVTAYSAQQYPGRTADGTSTWGALAAGDNIAAGPAWMLGKRIAVWTPWGEAVYRLADTGHLAVNGIDFDLLFATTAEALQWGRRTVPVCVEG